jgi:hypothetical protein
MRRRFLHAALLAVLAGGLLIACGGGSDAGPVMGVDANGTSTFNADNLAAQLATYPLSGRVAATCRSTSARPSSTPS